MGTGGIGAPRDLTARYLISSLIKFVSNEPNLEIEEIWLVNLDQMNSFNLTQELENPSLNRYVKIYNDQKINSSIGNNTQGNPHTSKDKKYKKLLQRNELDVSNLSLDVKNNHSTEADDVIDKNGKITDKSNSNKNDETDRDLRASASAINTFKTCEICSEDKLNEKDIIKLKNCSHELCKICYKRNTEINPKCPFCQKYYQIPRGTQPKNGQMTHRIIHTQLPGFHDCETIEITYNIPPGVQEANHPDPGKYYNGIQRLAYLPNNKKGNEVLKLLKQAFNQSLIFTIGESRTMGIKGVVTWNDIHHKTSINGS